MKTPFDFQKFTFRTNKKQREVAAEIGVSPGLVGNWGSKRAVPSYANILKLIEIGMTADELFGPELAKKLKENDPKVEYKAPDFEELKNTVRDILVDFGLGTSVPKK